MKCANPDAGNAVWNIDTLDSEAEPKCILIDTCDTVSDGYIRQGIATNECGLPDAGNIAPNTDTS